MIFKKKNINKIKKLLATEERANHIIAFDIILSNQIEITEELQPYLIDLADLCVQYGAPFIEHIDGIDALGGFKKFVKIINKKNEEKNHPEAKVEAVNKENNRLVNYCEDNVRGNTHEEVKEMILQEITKVVEL